MQSSSTSGPAPVAGAHRCSFVDELERLAPPSPTSDGIIIAIMDATDPAIVAQVRRGFVQMPLDKVPALALALNADPEDLVKRWLQDYVEGDSCPLVGVEAAITPLADDLPTVDPDYNGVLSHRYREATLMSIARVAKAKELTQKQLISQGLVAMGVEMHPADLGVRKPVRRRAMEI